MIWSILKGKIRTSRFSFIPETGIALSGIWFISAVGFKSRGYSQRHPVCRRCIAILKMQSQKLFRDPNYGCQKLKC